MSKKLAKIIFIVLILSLFMSLASLALAAQETPPNSCLEEYTVQAGDWISTIAEKYYGDVSAYTAIVNATNIAAAEASKYLSINNPNLIEAGQVLCIPAVEEAQALLSGQQLLLAPAPSLPEEKMLVIVGNRTLTNQPTALTLSGGQFGAGQTFNLEPAQEMRLEVEPGDYKATWSGPGGITFGRTFKAVAGRVAIGWIVPEENYVFIEVQRGRPGEDDPAQAILGQLTMPSVMTTTTPYTTAEGETLLVAGNRGFADIPTTLTLSGGQFGEGKIFNLNPGQEMMLALEPGDYRASWSAAGEETGPFTLSGEFTAAAGRVGILWIVPEVSRAFFQRPGEPGYEIK